VGGGPRIRQQVGEPDGGVRRDAAQDVGEVRPRVDPVPPARRGERSQHGGRPPAHLAPPEQPVPAADGDAPQGPLGRAVVCALLRRGGSSGGSPDRRMASPPEALGADQEATNDLKHPQRRLLSKEVRGRAGRNGQGTPRRPRYGQWGSRPAITTGKADGVREATPDAPNPSPGVVVTARTRMVLQAAREVCTGAARQRRAREGQRRPGQMADGPVVPTNPGNAGGGKGPWFGSGARRGNSPGD
jgi:hypothetical protein